MTKAKWYVGIRRNNLKRELFCDDYIPTEDNYPQYVAIIGPHRTKRGAIFMRDRGNMNPHVQTSYDADRIAAQIARSDKNMDA